MNNIKQITSSGLRYYKKCVSEMDGRYRSWEHCYSIFHKSHTGDNVDIDYLSLHLAFYLASWGMYRGSSFLLQKDYKVHSKAIKELLKAEYNSLWGISARDYLKKENQEKIEKLSLKLKNTYLPIKNSVDGFELSDSISDTLITKILMGTLGCTPAYDRYFIDGIKNTKIASGLYNTKSILCLADYYEKNLNQFEYIRKQMNVGKIKYPSMKLIDSCFWQI